MHIFVLSATYELCVSRKSHLRDHPRDKQQQGLQGLQNFGKSRFDSISKHKRNIRAATPAGKFATAEELFPYKKPYVIKYLLNKLTAHVYT
jgi:hypothetical protein